MPNNNPSGVNGFQGFGTEEAYGQATQDKSLAAGAPLAGGKLAAGAITAPKKAQKKAVKGAPTETRAPFMMAPDQPMEVPSPAPALDPAQTWQQIAAAPGAESFPLLHYYASRA